jgi:hypothetical protein
VLEFTDFGDPMTPLDHIKAIVTPGTNYQSGTKVPAASDHRPLNSTIAPVLVHYGRSSDQ